MNELTGKSHRAIPSTTTASPTCVRTISSPIRAPTSPIGGRAIANDKRWQYGVPPPRNAKFAWVQHIIYHLAPAGVAGFVLANGSMSSNTSGEGEIRKNLIEADLIDCMVALPGQLFYTTQIPACLWFIAKNKRNGKFRNRQAKHSSSTHVEWAR